MLKSGIEGLSRMGVGCCQPLFRIRRVSPQGPVLPANSAYLTLSAEAFYRPAASIVDTPELTMEQCMQESNTLAQRVRAGIKDMTDVFLVH